MNDAEAAPTAPTNVHDLPPELIGRAATYLDIRGGDFWKLFTFVAGRRDNIEKRIIKRVYLERNVQLILYVSDVYSVFPLEKARMIRLGEACRQWMEFNDDWRNSIKPYHGIDMPGMFADVELKAIRDEDVCSVLVMYCPSGHVGKPSILSASAYFSDDSPAFRRNAVVVGIDGRDVSGLDFEDVTRLLYEGHSTPTKLRLMTSGAAHIFLNPAVAIDLGLTEVLRYLIEDVEIDVNTQSYGGVVFNHRMPPIAHALVHPDPSAFQYLTSVSGLDANPVLLSFTGYERAFTLLHQLAFGDCLLDVTRIVTLLNRDEVDVDALHGRGHTPLHCIIARTGADVAMYDRAHLMLAKALLDAGASTDHVDLGFIPNRQGYNGMMLTLLEAADREERDDIIASLDRQKRRREV
mmetsp:Transcript_27578/g.59924  ORF Transcript_27578/g.59924 Transcript_27578/m.59924 type:complete len:408 (-) Transcript_27578:108-1331(-)